MRLYWTGTMDSGNYKYQFVAGNLALDFVNTVAFRADFAKQKDHLQSADDVRRWARQAQLPDRAAISSGALAKTALRRIGAVREDLFAVFHAVASGEPIPLDPLTRAGNALLDCCTRRCLTLEKAEVRWTWRTGARCADYLLYPVLTAAT